MTCRESILQNLEEIGHCTYMSLEILCSVDKCSDYTWEHFASEVDKMETEGIVAYDEQLCAYGLVEREVA